MAPQVVVPPAAVPQMVVPQAAVPQAAAPQVVVPQVAATQVAMAQATAPQVSLSQPKVVLQSAMPRVVPPQVYRPQGNGVGVASTPGHPFEPNFAPYTRASSFSTPGTNNPQASAARARSLSAVMRMSTH